MKNRQYISLVEIVIVIIIIALLALMMGLAVRNVRLRQESRLQLKEDKIFDISKAGAYRSSRIWEVEYVVPQLGGYSMVTLKVAGAGDRPDAKGEYLFQEFPFESGDCLIVYSSGNDIELLKVGTVENLPRAIPAKPLDSLPLEQESSPVAVEASPQGGEH